ncbi:pentapeptide repeat-containing protein [Streptomyces sparsogenes]|uniref:pentapeptide repeat-containing protein n=1 Tax=Streptomyces sparsogenes TaxID=67365 RepID=UPI00331A4F65
MPDWPYCAVDAARDAAGVGCRGRSVEPSSRCLAHLSDDERRTYFSQLSAGANVDHRGTVFSSALLDQLLDAVADYDVGHARLGEAKFNEAVFTTDADFRRTEFTGEVSFTHARIARDARFGNTRFHGYAWFVFAEVGGDAEFGVAEFDNEAWLERVQIGGNVSFSWARFGGSLGLADATIGGDATFSHAKVQHVSLARVSVGGTISFSEVESGADIRLNGTRAGGDLLFTDAAIGGSLGLTGARVDGNLDLSRVSLERTSQLGPLAVGGAMDLSDVVFGTAVIIEVAATALICRRTRFASTAALRLRYASVDLSDAGLEFPVTVNARPRPFTSSGREVGEEGLVSPQVQVVSLQGVDAAHLVLADIDLTECRFAGTVHLDQLRLEGLYQLPFAPPGVRRLGPLPVRYTPRRTLAEEHHWRHIRRADPGGWSQAPPGVDVLSPAALAPIYRQVRKAFEDGKHEPGAADFYYGEMEMRRHAHDIPVSERLLLTAYWALSGYGLRAARAFAWLLVAMSATVVAMMLWGLPKDDPEATSSGTVSGRRITITTQMSDPVNPTGAYWERLSGKRFEKSLRVVINSVVFRSSGQELTTSGVYTEMASRIAEPLLLGLGVLAIRGRVKR